MAYELKIKIKFKCSRHPKFTPEDGEGSIKGGCGTCFAIHDVYMRAQRLEETIQKAREVIGGQASQKDSGSDADKRRDA